MSLATVAAIVGIGAGGMSIYEGMHRGSGGGGGPAGSTYVPQGQGQSDQAWMQFMQQLQQMMGGAGGQFNPAIMGAFQEMMGMMPGARARGEIAGQQSVANANLAQLYQTQLQNAAAEAQRQQGNLYGAGNQLWQTALDPQNALRDKLLGQTRDQSRLATSARGIGTSGESAGIENQDVQNFMLNWENQQLGRQSEGLRGMSGAFDAAGRQGQLSGADLSGSMGFSQMTPEFTMMASLYPMMAAGLPINFANQAGGAMNQDIYAPYGGFMNMMLDYMTGGRAATNQQFGQFQTGLNNLTTGLGQLGKNWNMGPGQWFGPGMNTNPGGGWTAGAGAGPYNFDDPYNSYGGGGP